MKALKFIICSIVLLFSQEAFSYVLVINKTFLSHDPNGAQPNYSYVNRKETLEYEPLDPNTIKSKTVDIFCHGNGQNTCPNQICIPTDIGNPPAFMTLSAISAAQSLFTTAVGNYESTGTMTNSSGTISTPDGLLYSYVIAWTSSAVNGDTIQLTFTSIP